MSATKIILIRLSVNEYRYAKSLSLRTQDCPRPNVGSVAHGLKVCLRKMAVTEKIPLSR